MNRFIIFLKSLQTNTAGSILALIAIGVVGGFGGLLQAWNNYDPWLAHQASSSEAFAFGMAAAVIGIFVLGNTNASASVGKVAALSLVFGYSGTAVMTKAQSALVGDSGASTHLAAAKENVDGKIKEVEDKLSSAVTEDAKEHPKIIKDMEFNAEYLIDLIDVSDDSTVRLQDRECLLRIKSFYSDLSVKGDEASVKEAAKAIEDYARSREFTKLADAFRPLADITISVSAVNEKPTSGWVKYADLKSGVDPFKIDLNTAYDGDRLFAPVSGIPLEQFKGSSQEVADYGAQVTAVTDVYLRDSFPNSLNLESFFKRVPEFIVSQGSVLKVSRAVQSQEANGKRCIWFFIPNLDPTDLRGS